MSFKSRFPFLAASYFLALSKTISVFGELSASDLNCWPNWVSVCNLCVQSFLCDFVCIFCLCVQSYDEIINGIGGVCNWCKQNSTYKLLVTFLFSSLMRPFVVPTLSFLCFQPSSSLICQTLWFNQRVKYTAFNVEFEGCIFPV